MLLSHSHITTPRSICDNEQSSNEKFYQLYTTNIWLVASSVSKAPQPSAKLKNRAAYYRASAAHTPPPAYLNTKTNTLLVVIKKRVVANYCFSNYLISSPPKILLTCVLTMTLSGKIILMPPHTIKISITAPSSILAWRRSRST